MVARGEQLKGCPFCGSDKVVIDADCGRHHFKCLCCGMLFEFSADTKTELIRKWNRRAQPLERAEAAEAEARRTAGDEAETPWRGGGVMANKVDIVDECLKLECEASCTAVRIYNIIREVGRGELTADNALHQLVEDYHNLKILSAKIGSIADYLKKEGK